MIIDTDCVVAFHYRLTDDDGELLDSSEGQDPLAYLHGAHGIIPGLENALAGRAAGDKLQVAVPPEEGYGEIDPGKVEAVPRAAFNGIDDLQPGMPLQASDNEGNVLHVVVKAVSETEVTVDANHPLAGKVLHFDVEITSVRAATEEELAHGHAH